MKKFLASSLFCLALILPAGAHIGSPNVFFEGPAGAYSIYAVVRPPAALPGAADVSVQIREGDVASVSLTSVQWQAGREGSPLPVSCERAAGSTSLWSGQVWFLRPGSYTLELSLEGSKGGGKAIVPVNILGLPGRQMGRALQVALGIAGVALLLGVVAIVRAISREALLPLGEKPIPAASNWRVTVIAVIVLTAGVAAGAIRWREMDRVYRAQGIQKPEPVTATLLAEPERLLLELQPVEQSLGSASWSQLVPDHGKLMHLFLIREPVGDVFAHLHPLRQNGQTFMLELPPLAAGDYQLYGELTFENGLNQTLTSKVALPPPLGQAALPPLSSTNAAGDVICGTPSLLTNEPGSITRDMDDSWHVERAPTAAVLPGKRQGQGPIFARLMGGYSLIFENAQRVEAGLDKELRLAAFAPDGREVPLQSYMGMPGHAVVRREGGSVFAHLHPSGSFSMASQQLFQKRLSDSEPGETKPSVNFPASNRVSFPYEFPNPGSYTVWIQVRIAGRVLTGVYNLKCNGGSVL
jgi:hypothetical protein